MRFNFPKVKFADENSVRDQLRHVVSEMFEVIDGYMGESGHVVVGIEEEVMDLTHSLETFWRIRMRTHGVRHVELLRERVEEKNRLRGYYEREEKGNAEEEGGSGG
jgi:hypothetical protein